MADKYFIRILNSGRHILESKLGQTLRDDIMVVRFYLYKQIQIDFINKHRRHNFVRQEGTVLIE